MAISIEEAAGMLTGVVVRVPAGTVIGGRYNQETRAWSNVTTTVDAFVELRADAGELRGLVLRALSNKSGKSVDGALGARRAAEVKR